MPNFKKINRRAFGQVQPKKIISDVGLQVNRRKLLKNINTLQNEPDNELSGEGFIDIIRSIARKGQKIGSKLVDFATGETGTALRNLIPDSDKTARPAFPGERHAILKLPNGKFGSANYMGQLGPGQ